jgi:hypothetical protein
VIDGDKEETLPGEKEETLDGKKKRTPKEKMTTKMTNLFQEFRENHVLLGGSNSDTMVCVTSIKTW